MVEKILSSETLNVKGLMNLTGWSKSRVYYLTSKGLIPYYKPLGKTIFFSKKEVENWLLQNRQVPKDELEAVASGIVNKKIAAL